MLRRAFDKMSFVFLILGCPAPIAWHWASGTQAWMWRRIPSTLFWLLAGILVSPLYFIGIAFEKLGERKYV